MASTKDLRKGRNILLDKRDESLRQLQTSPADVPANLQKFYGYEAMLKYVLENGVPKADRTGTGTIGIHGYQLRFDLDNGFPFVTTKRVAVKSVIHELLWLLRGDTNIRYLAQNKVDIWNDWPFKNYWQNQPENAGKPFPNKGTQCWNESGMDQVLEGFVARIRDDENFAKKWGELGPVYGKQWRKWVSPELKPVFSDSASSEDDIYVTIDQIQIAIDQLKKQHETGVMNRRVIVTAWNPADIAEMSKSGLPPCHCFFQMHSVLMSLEERQAHWATKNNQEGSWSADMDDDALDAAGAPFLKLDLQLYQRSCDIFLGVPFNIASYSLLLLMIAQVTNMKPGTFIHDYGDLHIYSNHLEQVGLQLSRAPYAYPTINLANRSQGIDGFTFDDVTVNNYQFHKAIAGAVAI